MSIAAGKQKGRIVVYRVIDATDSAGGAVNTLVPYWATRAEIRPLRSIKTIQANQDKFINGFTFLIRYRNDKTLAVDMYISYKSGRYVITGVENVGEQNKELLVTAMYTAMLIPGSEFTAEFTKEFGSV